MHRHDTDQTALTAGQLPLDLDIISGKPDKKTDQRGRLEPFIGQRLRQKFGNPVLGLGSQTGKHRVSPVMPGEQARDQIIGADDIRHTGQITQYFKRLLMCGFAQSLP